MWSTFEGLPSPWCANSLSHTGYLRRDCQSTRSLDDGEDRPKDQVLGKDPKTHLDVVLRDGPYGPYVQLGEKEEGSKTKPPRSSLPKAM